LLGPPASSRLVALTPAAVGAAPSVPGGTVAGKMPNSIGRKLSFLRICQAWILIARARRRQASVLPPTEPLRRGDAVVYGRPAACLCLTGSNPWDGAEKRALTGRAIP